MTPLLGPRHVAARESAVVPAHSKTAKITKQSFDPIRSTKRRCALEEETPAEKTLHLKSAVFPFCSLCRPGFRLYSPLPHIHGIPCGGALEEK